MDCNKTAQCKNLHIIRECLIFPKLLKMVLLMMFHRGHTNSFIILGVKGPSNLRTPKFSTLETAGSCHISFGPYIQAKCHLKSPCHTSRRSLKIQNPPFQNISEGWLQQVRWSCSEMKKKFFI